MHRLSFFMGTPITQTSDLFGLQSRGQDVSTADRLAQIAPKPVLIVR